MADEIWLKVTKDQLKQGWVEVTPKGTVHHKFEVLRDLHDGTYAVKNPRYKGNPRRIELFWLSYMDAVVPKGASQAQLMETKRAFFGGAAIGYLLCTHLPEDEAASLQLLKELDEELQAFQVKLGVSE